MKPSRRRLGVFFGTAAILLLLLILLTLAERGAEDSSIKTFGDACWYFLITLSTVGYGDLYPVTPLGRALSSIFVLMSVGALAFAVGSAISLMRGELLPKIRLRLLGGKPVFLMTEWNSAARSLLENIAAETPDARFLFPAESNFPGASEELAGRCISPANFSAEQILSNLPENTGEVEVLVTGGDSYENERIAERLSRFPYPITLRTLFEPAVLSGPVTAFNEYDCTARLYWKRFPLLFSEHVIIIQGFGKYGRELLSRALEVNVFGPLHRAEYHIFGDSAVYIADHPELKNTVSLNARSGTEDSVFFETGSFRDFPELLKSADRVIFCEEEEEENASLCEELMAWFAVTARVHVRGDHAPRNAESFGSAEEIFTAPLVLRKELTRQAAQMHDIYRKSAGDGVPAFEDLSPFLRQSNLAAADHLAVKVRILLEYGSGEKITIPETGPTKKQFAAAYQKYLSEHAAKADLFRQIEHDRWNRFHRLRNWTYDPVRNNALRRHHLLVPFGDLPPAEQEKDDYAWELLGKFAVSGDLQPENNETTPEIL